MLKIPFDPIRRAKEVEEIVMKNLKRKYYRFRFTLYYGGIVTADTIGCCMLCAYCWNYFRNLKPMEYGYFYSSEEVAKKLIKISIARNCKKFRISGAEPILGEKSLEHLLKVIELVNKKVKNAEFILETNGLILGYYPELIEQLLKYKDFLCVRISIKGWDEKSFQKISGANGEYFVYPLIALKKLLKNKIYSWPAAMYDVFKEDGIKSLRKRLNKLGVKTEIETEFLEKYPFVIKNLRERNITVKLK
jgi:uncharacterized Fe-S cluster-containing radical SAM superfamily protein